MSSSGDGAHGEGELGAGNQEEGKEEEETAVPSYWVGYGSYFIDCTNYHHWSHANHIGKACVLIGRAGACLVVTTKKIASKYCSK